MKISEVISNLEFMKNTYGDLDITISLEDEDGEICSEDNLIFSTDMEKVYIQNFVF